MPVKLHSTVTPRPAEAPSVDQIAIKLASVGLHSVWLEDLEWAAIRNALAAYEGNRTRAANSLGISLRTLQRKLKEARTILQSETQQSSLPDRRPDA